MIKDERWPVARLIPVTTAIGVEAKERSSASALLAVVGAVEEFGRTILKPLGAPSGKVETFIEVPFKVGDSTIRPDGVITVSRGSKTWVALVEVKTGANDLVAAQVEAYLDLARQLEFDALLTISNQYVTLSSAYPVAIDRKKLRGVQLHHWSWFRVLTEAEVQKRHRGVKDTDQAYILGELIRYLSDGRSGIVMFGDMGPSWTAVRDGARMRTLRKNDPHVENVAGRWDEMMRFLSLDLRRELGREVRHLASKTESTPAARLQSLREALASTGRLSATLHIPDTVAPLEIVCDLAARQVSVSTHIDPPRDSRSRGRVSWLLRQLSKSPPQLVIEAKLSRSTSSLSVQHKVAREEPERLVPDKDKEIRQFVLTLTRDMGLNRAAGRGGFIDSVMAATKTFYAEVLQNLSAWKAKPAKLPTERLPIDEIGDLPDVIESALDAAEKEAQPLSETPVKG